MTNIQTISHKRGATFSYGGLVKLPLGSWVASSSLVMLSGVKLQPSLQVSLTPLGAPGSNGETHSLLIESPASTTKDWPIASLHGDIVFQDAQGVVLASQTFRVMVESGVSNAI